MVEKPKEFRLLSIAFVLAGVILGVVGSVWLLPSLGIRPKDRSLKKFDLILNKVVEEYVEYVDVDKLTEAAARGLLKDLDPHSIYIPAQKKKIIDDNMRGNYAGLGLTIIVVRDTLLVAEIHSELSEDNNGIAIGDRILAADSLNLVGINSVDSLVNVLRGAAGTAVQLRLYRASKDSLFSKSVTRRNLEIESVVATAPPLHPLSAYIQITHFHANTHRQFMEKLNWLRDQHSIERLILDLRNNSGGYLEQAIKVVDELVPDKQLIAFTKGKNESSIVKYHSTKKNNFFETMPIIVLINKNSASAAEVVAGALQDLDRALIVGETSFGKGLVQRQFTMNDGSALRLTTARYFTPSGRCIQRSYYDEKLYYAHSGRSGDDLSEGDNFNHQEKPADTLLPKYKTIGGRTVYGGGGIVPDYIIAAEGQKPLFRRLEENFLIPEAILSEAAESMRIEAQDYVATGVGVDRFTQEYAITEKEHIHLLKATAQKYRIGWDEERYMREKDEIHKHFYVYLTRLLQSRLAAKVVSIGQDKYVRTALDLFDGEAMAKLNSSSVRLAGQYAEKIR